MCEDRAMRTESSACCVGTESFASLTEQTPRRRIQGDDGEVKHGTGAPVYDSQPYGDLMAMLEEQRPTTGKYRRW